MNKHTPGPWWFSAAEEGYYVAGVGDKELTNLIQKEDARLIASAPALLAELQNIVNVNTRDWEDASDFKAWAQNRARAAIAKATGETE